MTETFLSKPRRHKKPRVRTRAAQTCRRMEEAIAAALDVPLDEMRSSSRTADVAFARQSSMYLAHVTLGLGCEAVGRVFSRHRTTAAHACLTVEMRRDDPAIDRLLDVLENACIDIVRDMRARVGTQP